MTDSEGETGREMEGEKREMEREGGRQREEAAA